MELNRGAGPGVGPRKGSEYGFKGGPRSAKSLTSLRWAQESRVVSVLNPRKRSGSGPWAYRPLQVKREPYKASKKAKQVKYKGRSSVGVGEHWKLNEK